MTTEGDVLLAIVRGAVADSVPGRRRVVAPCLTSALAGAAFCAAGAALTTAPLGELRVALARSASLGAVAGALYFLARETRQLLSDIRTHWQLRAFLTALEASQTSPPPIAGVMPFSGQPFKLRSSP